MLNPWRGVTGKWPSTLGRRVWGLVNCGTCQGGKGESRMQLYEMIKRAVCLISYEYWIWCFLNMITSLTSTSKNVLIALNSVSISRSKINAGYLEFGKCVGYMELMWQTFPLSFKPKLNFLFHTLEFAGLAVRNSLCVQDVSAAVSIKSKQPTQTTLILCHWDF